MPHAETRLHPSKTIPRPAKTRTIGVSRASGGGLKAGSVPRAGSARHGTRHGKALQVGGSTISPAPSPAASGSSAHHTVAHSSAGGSGRRGKRHVTYRMTTPQNTDQNRAEVGMALAAVANGYTPEGVSAAALTDAIRGNQAARMMHPEIPDFVPRSGSIGNPMGRGRRTATSGAAAAAHLHKPRKTGHAVAGHATRHRGAVDKALNLSSFVGRSSPASNHPAWPSLSIAGSHRTFGHL